MQNLSVKITRKKNAILRYLKCGFLKDKIRFETSSLCQLRCPLCRTGQNNYGVEGKGYLKFENFKKFFDNYSILKRAEISNWGEIFLNPELEKILEYAHNNNIILTANNGVNFNNASDNQIQAIVKYELRSMTVSIDGITQETYHLYRKGGNIDNVLENIQKLNYYKLKNKIEYPKLKWQFILFGHNENELEMAKKMAKDLQMDFRVKLNGRPSFSPIKNIEQAKKETGFSSWHEYHKKNGTIKKIPCSQLWDAPVINWDGKLLGCCRNRFVHFGNVFKNGLKQCISSEKYKYTKKVVMGKAPIQKDVPCVSCRIYKIMKNEMNFIKPYSNNRFKRRLLSIIFS